MFFEYLCLRALSRARRAKQNDIHQLSPLVVEQPATPLILSLPIQNIEEGRVHDRRALCGHIYP